MFCNTPLLMLFLEIIIIGNRVMDINDINIRTQNTLTPFRPSA